MARLQLAGVAAATALAVGLLLGLVTAPGDSDAAPAPRTENVKLERVAAPAIGSVDVPALKLPKSTPVVVTPPPPVGPTRPTSPPPPPVVTPLPPPPPPPPGITIDPGGGVN